MTKVQVELDNLTARFRLVQVREGRDAIVLEDFPYKHGDFDSIEAAFLEASEYEDAWNDPYLLGRPPFKVIKGGLN